MARRRPLDADDLRRIVLALPEAVEGSHMGHPDFRVRKKIFATLAPDGRTACFKVAPEDLDALVTAEPATYRTTWGGRYLAVDLARADAKALRAIAADAWALTAPKRLVAEHRAAVAGETSYEDGRRR